MRPRRRTTEARAAKDALARLADPSPVVAAERALRDVERAASFHESGGLARLRRVADRPAEPRADRARGLLAAFEGFRRAARGHDPVDDGGTSTDQFRPGRDTPMGNARQPRDR